MKTDFKLLESLQVLRAFLFIHLMKSKSMLFYVKMKMEKLFHGLKDIMLIKIPGLYKFGLTMILLMI
jgi:hypothetical protein